MQKAEFKALVKHFKAGNTSPKVAIEIGVPMKEFTQVLKAFHNVQKHGKSRRTMEASILDSLIDENLDLGQFSSLTGYGRETYYRYVDESVENNSELIWAVCKEFDLNPEKTIREQWFGEMGSEE